MKMTLPQKLEIEKTNNGFILSYEEEIDDEYITVQKEVIGTENWEDEYNEVIKILLEKVAEHFGCIYDKFSENNLEISFTGKGSKL